MRASEVRIGDQIRLYGVVDTVMGVTRYDGGVMLFLGSEVNNPFVSSTYASFREDAEIEVVW